MTTSQQPAPSQTQPLRGVASLSFCGRSRASPSPEVTSATLSDCYWCSKATSPPVPLHNESRLVPHLLPDTEYLSLSLLSDLEAHFYTSNGILWLARDARDRAGGVSRSSAHDRWFLEHVVHRVMDLDPSTPDGFFADSRQLLRVPRTEGCLPLTSRRAGRERRSSNQVAARDRVAARRPKPREPRRARSARIDNAGQD